MTETKQETEVDQSTIDKPSRLSPKKEEMAKGPATRQMKARRRYPPRAPGFFPVPVDIFMAMTLRFGLVIANFFVISTSFAYDGEDIGWIIFAEIVITYIGFAYFVKRISRQIIIYKKFFRSLNEWHDEKIEEVGSSCCCLWYILIKLAWWVIVLLKFPFIIAWAMYQSYKWYQDRRRNAESEIDLTQRENVKNNKQYWKMEDRAYSIWHLGILSKQATMILIIIQDIPLLIIAIYIVNYLGIIVYSIAIIYNLVLWFKHMYDLGKFTLFYKDHHYADHFGINEIEYSSLFGYCNTIVADYYTEFEHELSTLQVGDWVWVYNEETDSLKVMIIWKNRHFKMNGDNLVLAEWNKIDKKAIEDFDNGLAKKIYVDPELIHTVNRWDGNVCLLRNKDYIIYHDHGGRDVNGGNGDGDDSVKEEQVAESVAVQTGNNNTEVEDQTDEPKMDPTEEEVKREISEHVVVEMEDDKDVKDVNGAGGDVEKVEVIDDKKEMEDVEIVYDEVEKNGNTTKQSMDEEDDAKEVVLLDDGDEDTKDVKKDGNMDQDEMMKDAQDDVKVVKDVKEEYEAVSLGDDNGVNGDFDGVR